MKIYPADKFELSIPISCEEAQRRISENTDQWKLKNAWVPGKKAFFGTGTQRDFKIYRAIKYGNSFLPIVLGTFQSKTEGCLVTASLRMPIITIAFMLFWLGSVTLGLVATLLAGEKWEYLALMFVLGYGLMWGGFWFEAPRTKRALHEALSVAANK